MATSENAPGAKDSSGRGVEEPPEKPSVSGNRIEAGKSAWNDLDVLYLKAARKKVQRRYHSVVELMQDIDHYLKGEPLKAPPRHTRSKDS